MLALDSAALSSICELVVWFCGRLINVSRRYMLSPSDAARRRIEVPTQPRQAHEISLDTPSFFGSSASRHPLSPKHRGETDFVEKNQSLPPVSAYVGSSKYLKDLDHEISMSVYFLSMHFNSFPSKQIPQGS